MLKYPQSFNDFRKRTFLSHKIDLITLMTAMATAVLIFTHFMAVMRLRITSRTPWRCFFKGKISCTRNCPVTRGQEPVMGPNREHHSKSSRSGPAIPLRHHVGGGFHAWMSQRIKQKSASSPVLEVNPFPTLNSWRKAPQQRPGLITAWCYIIRTWRVAVAHFYPPQFATMRDCVHLGRIPLQRMWPKPKWRL